MLSRRFLEKLLIEAGITINGDKSYDIKIHNEKVFDKVTRNGSLGLGESYMDGDWDCERLDLFIERILRLNKFKDTTLVDKLLNLKSKLFNLQTIFLSKQSIHKHYDLSNEMYFGFLDKYLQYSCGYFENTENLEVAQKQKLDLICKKLELKEGETLLDIGCGWGGLARYAAENYRVKVVGIGISKEQIRYAKDFTKGLDVEILNLDYRDLRSLNIKFDKIVSVGMMEHVGYKNYREYMQVASDVLKEDGLFLLHTIGSNKTVYNCNPFIDRYIFPGGVLPSVSGIGMAYENLFIMEDWHNFGPHYYKTLIEWDENFVESWHKISHKYDERFYRMFRYYLLSCAGGFKARHMQLWQIVFSKGKSDEVYKSIR